MEQQKHREKVYRGSPQNGWPQKICFVLGVFKAQETTEKVEIGLFW